MGRAETCSVSDRLGALIEFAGVTLDTVGTESVSIVVATLQFGLQV